MSPVLDAQHDFAHPVEGDTAWSESYYFNCYDPATDCGFFSRVGVRPNEGTIDVGLAIWVPGGGLAHLRFVREQREMVDRELDVGPVRYALLEPARQWQLTASGDSTDGAVAMDVTFDALMPFIGVDGQGREGSGSSRPRVRPSAKVTSNKQADGRDGSRSTDTRHVLGPDTHGQPRKSWGPRRWGGPKMWRWFSINIDDATHFGGIQIGTDVGDLHRGWVWCDGEHASIAGVARQERAGG